MPPGQEWVDEVLHNGNAYVPAEGGVFSFPFLPPLFLNKICRDKPAPGTALKGLATIATQCQRRPWAKRTAREVVDHLAKGFHLQLITWETS
ncbi:hypothetical protein [Flavisolibacter nicotianae]|uniref:hypothetical protein n=1 Tax=Flavisolibacter nicotianae TaxID=2364882 RepID=UPI000EB24272|nr:hypothetical protein [Flavisolibacter nicotianae]